MQEALALADHVAKVILIERGDRLAGQTAYKEKVEANGKIECRFGATVAEILGQDHVAGVKVRDLASGEEADIEPAAVFVFARLSPNSGFLRDAVSLDEAGRVVTDASRRASLKGIFAAGAMGDDARAATAADRYLETGEWPA